MSVAVVMCDSDTDLYTDTGKLITSVIVDTANLHNLVNLKTAGYKTNLQSILVKLFWMIWSQIFPN